MVDDLYSFRQRLIDASDNQVLKWDSNKFLITCGQCNSHDVAVLTAIDHKRGWDNEETGTSWSSEWEGAVFVKCKTCGKAMIIAEGREILKDGY